MSTDIFNFWNNCHSVTYIYSAYNITDLKTIIMWYFILHEIVAKLLQAYSELQFYRWNITVILHVYMWNRSGKQNSTRSKFGATPPHTHTHAERHTPLVRSEQGVLLCNWSKHKMLQNTCTKIVWHSSNWTALDSVSKCTVSFHAPCISESVSDILCMIIFWCHVLKNIMWKTYTWRTKWQLKC